MYAKKNKFFLPCIAAAAGSVAMAARFGLYALAADHRGLLKTGHILEIFLWILTIAAALWAIDAAGRCGGLRAYDKNFPASGVAFAGHLLAAAGIGLTVLLQPAKMPGLLGLLWKTLGIASIPCLVLGSLARRRGAQPPFILYMVPCLFLAMHLIDHYQLWSSEPQMQNYLFSLLAGVLLMVFAYQRTAFCVGLGSRRVTLAAGLAAGYCAFAAASGGDSLPLYLGCGLWALSDIPDPTARRRRREAPQ